MTKQKEIRDGVDKKIKQFMPDIEDYYVLRHAILNYLDSIGCRLLVERELPENPILKLSWLEEKELNPTDIYTNAQQDMLKAGYSAFERLIEEEK